MAKPDKLNAEANQAVLEQRVREFVADKSFDTAFVYGETSYLLKVVKSPELRAQLLARYKEVTADVPLTSATFRQHLSVGGAVLEDPTLATQENIEFFEATVDSCAETLREGGMDAFELAKDQLSWRLSLRRHYSATPQELMEYLDLQTSQMLAADIPESSQEFEYVHRNKQFVSQLRDSLLGNYADNSAQAGDFINARLFIANIGSDVSQAYALKGCLPHAKTQEQIDIIKPDEMTLMFNPGLGMQFRVAEVLLGSDTDALSSLALELARDTEDAISYIAHEDVRRMYEVVAQQGDSIELARNLLAALREAGAKRHHTEHYSEVLIRAGNLEEPLQAYEDTDKNSLNMSWRLHGLWQLAHLLDERSQR